MVTVSQISKHKLSELVFNSYTDDIDLIEKYHIIKGDVNELTTWTMSAIEDASKKFDLKCYKILYNKLPIGYFVAWDKFLYSFAIDMKFRKKDILIDWWKQVKEVLGNEFRTMLYDNNTRAISFLQKNGMEILRQDDNLVILINNN